MLRISAYSFNFLRVTLVLLVLLVTTSFPVVSQAERLSLSGLNTRIDGLDDRLSNCEQGIGGVCQGSGGQLRNVITVALEGGDFTSIQAAIDSIPERVVPGSTASPPDLEVTPTLIKIAPGEYFEQIRMRNNVHLKGAGRDQTVLQSPSDLIADCGGREPIICIANVADVAIAGLTVSGLDQDNSMRAETAIGIQQSGEISIHDTRISDVIEGIIGEAVGNISIRNNHIPFPADAIDLAMINDPGTGSTPLPFAHIVSNQIDQGRVNVDGEGSAHVMGNVIAGGLFNEWQGAIHASGNQIVGDIQFNAEDDSIFSNNTMLGTLLLDGSKKISIIGNRISGSGFLIVDNGRATIVGNILQTDSNPILLALNGSSTVFANDHESSAGDSPVHNQLASKHSIQLESRNENVTIRAGNSTITVDADGTVTIDSKGDIELTADGEFSVDAASINMKSAAATTIQSGSNLNLKSSITTSVDGAIVDIAADSVVRIDGAARVNIDGGLITLN